MDNFSLSTIVNQFSELKFAFKGVWSADNFLKLSGCASPLFQIINTSVSSEPGAHWILLCCLPCFDDGGGCSKSNSKINKFYNVVVWNSLDIPFTYFTSFYARLQKLYRAKLYVIHEICSNPPVQNKSSNLCGLYCIYSALILVKCSKYYSLNFEQGGAVAAVGGGGGGYSLDKIKQVNCIFRKALQNLHYMNEVDIIRFFNNKLGSMYTFVIT